jgi:S-adenosylmethionine synthetase
MLELSGRLSGKTATINACLAAGDLANLCGISSRKESHLNRMSKMMNVTPKTSSMLSMTRNTTMRTAEHVSQGHPDKAADQFADSILDAIFDAAREIGASGANDPNHPTRQRAAIEMLVKDYLVLLSGEVRMGPGVASRVHVADIVRQKWADIGYPDADKITVINHIQVQSPELADSSDTDGAGDQGIMVGFATNKKRAAARI